MTLTNTSRQELITFIKTYKDDKQTTYYEVANTIGISPSSLSNFINEKHVGSKITSKVLSFYKSKKSRPRATRTPLPQTLSNHVTPNIKDKPQKKVFPETLQFEICVDNTSHKVSLDKLKLEKKDPGYIYILRQGTELKFKVGRSMDPQARFNNLKQGNIDLFVSLVVYCSNHSYAETILHDCLKEKQILNHTFRNTTSRNLPFNSPATEWYGASYDYLSALCLKVCNWVNNKLEE